MGEAVELILPAKGRIIHVAHKMAHEITFDSHERTWTLTPRQDHAAMYAGIHSLRDDWDILLIGWTGRIYESSETRTPLDVSNLTDDEKLAIALELRERHQCIPLFLDSESIAGHYNGYCKTIMWPLFNYMVWSDATNGRAEQRHWETYAAVNQLYADHIVQNYRDGDVAWVHDYHLLLVPEMVRSKIPKARIGLFVHAPFASSEIFRCLPKRQEILKGMMGANLVGFQTYAYARHFISTCTRVLGHESTPEGVDGGAGHSCHVGTFPIGIDPARVEQKCKDPLVLPKIRAIAEMYAGKKIVVARDKLDLVKGVLQKLAAFEKFLIEYPQWRNRVVLIQLTDDPTNESTDLERKVSDMVARINGTFGSLEFAPVHHFHHHIQPDEYYALLSIADAALITSGRDGMNTTSLEYVVCQQKKHSPLILSELMGTSGSMSSAIMVNPWDYVGVAKAINDALAMSEEEKRTRQMQLLSHVKSHTASFWAHSFIKMLVHTIPDQYKLTALLDTEELLCKYKSAEKRLLCFDYDGTLTPIRKTPHTAVPLPQTLTALETLCSDPKNEVWVISGRDEATLDGWLGHIYNLGLSAEHGSFMRYPGTGKWVNMTEHIDMNWKTDVVEIFTYYTERTIGSFIEHKRCAVTWHYRLADPEYGAFQAKECQNHLENAILSKMPVEVLVGKKKLEVRPSVVNKGEVVKRLLNDFDFCLCCGDDRTDEDMFKILNKSSVETKFSVVVGAEDKKTQALWHIPTAQDVTEAIHAMALAS
ncbi:threalose-6-phosphate phosphatase [Apophysomyces sp. BC1034]|nr:threalose-6-phosphate phosphatase [Apophysomyces sp. BC1015]KAG0175581.1 threalose-6-phosphate phosphatase [Apophysomyces sp. BC1021]KAG0186250.1 threalose-6-phosphate phosphatase [Apophysomyces sp. BC1034]